MGYRSVSFVFSLFIGAMVLISSGCDRHEDKLIVYAGKGLKAVVQDIVHSFEQRYGVEVVVVYGGSQTILSTLKKTEKGDIFIPGGLQYVEEAGDLVAYYKVVAKHRLTVAVRSDNGKNINSFQDLARSGISLAIGNKGTCAIGTTTEELLKRAGNSHDYLENVAIRASTANELLDLVIQGEVDAVITHDHMLKLAKSKDLRRVDIPASLVKAHEIPLAVLRVSENRQIAELFSSFVEKEGQQIFKKHGFGG